MSQPSGTPQRTVTPTAGLQAWTKHAYDVLVETASRYNAVISYSDLAEEVQSRSGLRTTSHQRNWISQVLGLIAHQNHRKGEPPLTALVVHKQDGQVGKGYDEVLRLAGLEPFDDPVEREHHAAAARLECYRRWCPYVPEDAEPTLATRVRDAPVPRRAKVAEVRRGGVCPTCFMEMPLSGDCPNCG